MKELKYDFTSIIDRRNLDASAVEKLEAPGYLKYSKSKDGFDRIPMWVADMNFSTVPTVVESIQKRASHGLYGYFSPRDEYFERIIHWHKSRNQVEGMLPEHIGYENSVLGCVMSAMSVLCSKGDNVLLHSPTYVSFFHELQNNGYNIVLSPLELDENQVWRMNFEDMEQKIKENKIHTVIFCSPHNPTGRVWEQDELEQAMKIFQKYDVTVISDEIWSDIILSGNKHIPLQSISEDARQRTIAVYAPSKTFNLAGLVGAYHVIYNSYLRDRIRKESSLCHYNEMNLLSMYALLGAYTEEGQEWTEELCYVLEKNLDYGYDFFTKKVEGIQVSRPQGTYMLFIDCREWCEKHGKTIDELMDLGYDHGVIWQDGRLFQGDGFLRLNFALPFERVQEAMNRLERYVFI